MILSHIVNAEDSGKTVKHILKNKLKISERLVKRLKYDEKILCNSIPVHINSIVNTGDIIEALIQFEEKSENVIPENIELDILFEDDCLIAVNKQPGMATHPSFSHPSGTIANGLMYYLNNKGIHKKVRPVSRLDRDTTGIVIFAKNEYIQQALILQMQNRTFCKQYLGIVTGIPEGDSGTINLPIERKPGSIMLRHVSPGGMPSITHYEVIELLKEAALLKFTLETGRTHQIRVHCQAYGHPLVGDTLYGMSEPSEQHNVINRQSLHSSMVSFIHPLSQAHINLTAPLPCDFIRALEILRK